MKKNIAIFCFLLTIMNSFSQQTPADILQIIKHLESLQYNKDDFHASAMEEINAQIATNADNPINLALWHFGKAELLRHFVNENTYRISKRTTIAGDKNEDFQTWDLQTFFAAIVSEYQLALQPEKELQSTDIQDFKELVVFGSPTEKSRATLYDLLSYCMLNFLEESEIFQLPAPMQPFRIDNELYFADNQHFTELKLTTTDTLSPKFLSLQIFQKLTNFHLKTQKSADLLELSLARLKFCYKNANSQKLKALYLPSLHRCEKEFSEPHEKAQICYEIAKFWDNKIAKSKERGSAEHSAALDSAVHFYLQAMELGPKSIFANNAKNALDVIEYQKFNFEMNAYLLPNQQNWVRYQYQNVEELYCRIVAISSSQYERISKLDTKQKYAQFAALPHVAEWRVNTELQGKFCEQTMDAALPALPVGTYALIIAPTPFSSDLSSISQRFFQVTNFDCIHRPGNNETMLFFFSRETGEPIVNQDVTVGFSDYYKKDIVKKKVYKTDKRGVITVPNNNDFSILHFEVKKGKDTYTNSFYFHNYDYPLSRPESCKLFVDRGIYRPGQTIYYKGIVMEVGNANPRVLPQNKVTIILQDPNNQEVTRAEAITNEFGSFSGTFQLPTNCVTGEFRLTCMETTQYVSVEEYKRPTFEVEIELPDKIFKLNETVEISGKATAYAGFSIDGATVRYRVVREAKFPYFFWYHPNSDDQEIAQGELKTDSEGKFTFNFIAEPDDNVTQYDPIFDYKIIINVTDISGETQFATTYISVSYKSLLIDIDIPETLELAKTEDAFTLTAKNTSGVRQNATIVCTLIELAMPQHYLHNRDKLNIANNTSNNLGKEIPYIDFKGENNQRNWREVEEKWRETISVNGSTKVQIPNLSRCKPGYYKIKLESVDSYGNAIQKEKYFFIFDEKSQECTVYSPLWLYCSNAYIKVGETLNLLIGSYLEDAHILLEITSNDTLLHSEWLNVKRGVKSYQMPISEHFRGDMRVSAFLCDHNFNYFQKKYITVPFTNKELKYEFVTFREKLLPGSEETWQIKVKDRQDNAISAELMCAMYDAALDAFKSNSFSFYVPYRNKKNDIRLEYDQFSNQLSGYFSPLKYVNWYEKPCTLHQLRLPFFANSRMMMSMAPSAARGNMAYTESISYDAVAEEGGAMKTNASASVMFDETTANNMQSTDNQTVTLRSNFNETAFFLPHLFTDEDGNVIFSFKIPESLTKWRFQGVAHTTDLKIGTFTCEVQTQKMLMVMPNAPRFFREGDTIVFSAKISNLSDTALSGKATLQLFDALTNAPLNILQSADNQDFTVVKGGSQAVQFRLAIPSHVEAITYRIFATTTGVEVAHTDGVEATLPVLPNRMLVTESMQLPIQGGKTKQFVFEKMKKTQSSTLQHHSFTLEFTPNPIWYAIQSLPYLIDYPYECNEQIFSKLYANSISTFIVNSAPKIKEVFEDWKINSPDAFCSQLEKNEELKSILLEETPWVLDAQNEAATRQRLGLLFDLQRMSNEQAAMLKKLEENQNKNGSWSWFKGGYPSRYITQHIVAGFGHLRSIGISEDKQKSVTKNAVNFLDAELTEDYKYLTSLKNINLEANHLISNTLHSFYARSFFLNDYSISSKNKKAYDYYLNQIKKYWGTHNIYMQAISALVLYRNGEEALAKTIMQTIKKRAQRSEELGMFWVKEGAGYFWTDALIERQALLIEAFQVILNDTESVDQMKIWLLKQKQTQNWNTTKATTEAVYALLISNDKLQISTDILEQPSDVEISVGGREVAQENAQAGTGYFKKVWTASEIGTEMADVTVKKANKGVAWGGLYWQYFENLDKITAHNEKDNPLALRKKLYKIVLNERGETLQEIGAETPLHVGDKVRVRVEIRADRDFEYVHLKDMRAATFEPTSVLSSYRYQDGLGYYESMRDAAANFFFDSLRKGTYVFEYTLVATQAGVFSNGISSIQCMYAPEFAAHSAGEKVQVLE